MEGVRQQAESHGQGVAPNRIERGQVGTDGIVLYIPGNPLAQDDIIDIIPA